MDDWEEIGRVLFLGLWRASLTVKAWRLVITAQGPGAIATRHVLLNNVAVVAAVLSARNRFLKLELRKLGLCAEKDRFFHLFFLLELVDTRRGFRERNASCVSECIACKFESRFGALAYLHRFAQHVRRWSRQLPLSDCVACFALADEAVVGWIAGTLLQAPALFRVPL